MKRKILCLTGTRADYPRIKSVLKKIESDSRFELYLVVTGTHLLKEYGYSIREIYNDKYKNIIKTPMYIGDFNKPLGMSLSASNLSRNFSKILNDVMPDLVLLTVDRVETLAAAMSASLMNFPIAHVQGGEVTGTIDESIRHAVTKLSHLHFVANEDAKKRIIKLGEIKKNIFNVGCPYIDLIKKEKLLSKIDLCKKYGIESNKKIILLALHSVTTEYKKSNNQIDVVLKALNKFNEFEILAFYSNADAGGKEIIKKINKSYKSMKVIPNVFSKDFLSFMKYAELMIGNSSAGIREAPSFDLPVINIGNRQNGRMRAKNVIDVKFNENEITKTINFVLNKDRKFKQKLKNIKNPYGNGNASDKIISVLYKHKLNNLIQKTIQY
jgi:GDP/UDP-N,N'-diacetylbacillosamine 2-epimerase (hydrolysing)